MFNAEIQAPPSMLILGGLRMCADIVIIIGTVMKDEVL